MKRWLRVVPVTVLLILAGAHPAYATFAEWLDKLGELSGPGPFKPKFVGSSLAIDVVCLEGQWWKKPVIDQKDPTVIAVTAAFLAKANDPFEITGQIRRYLATPVAPTRAVLPDPIQPVQALLATNPAALDAARQLARLAFWQLREELFDPAATGPPEARLRALIAQHKFNAALVEQMTVDAIDDSVKVAFSPYCTGDLRKPRVSFGVYAAWLTTSKVPADYHYPASVESLSSDIDAVPLALTARVSVPGVTQRHQIVLRSFDIGASLGAIQFSGDRFDSFWRPYGELPRITYRPLAFVACKGGECPAHWTAPWDLVEVEFVTKLIPGVTAEQFGATGPASGLHVQWAFRAGVSYKVLWDRFPHDFVK